MNNNGPSWKTEKSMKYLNITIVVVAAVIVVGIVTGSLIAIFGGSSAKGKKPVPNVVGLTDTEASNKIKLAGFEVVREYDYRTDGKSGTVLKQNRAPNSMLAEGEQVGIVIAQQGQIPVPDLTGKTFDEAVSLLKDRNFKFERKDLDTNNQEQDGKVSSQEPEPDQKLDPGATVSLLVYRYTPPVVTPQPTTPKPTTPKPTENWITCPTCGGSGHIEQTTTVNEQVTCSRCGGTGTIVMHDPDTNADVTQPCPTCGGTGKVTQAVQKTISVICPTCGGAGKIKQ
jgi:beta-lactam-binding protein with PASTA domain